MGVGLQLIFVVLVIFIHLVAISAAIPRGLVKGHQNNPVTSSKKEIPKTDQIMTAIQRLPVAFARTFEISFQSLIADTAIFVPLCLIAGLFHQHSTKGVWFKKSVLAGLEWGGVASVYTGFEEFLKTVRDKDDFWNRSLASGLASGLVQYRTQGFKGFATGFAGGFAFVLMFDIFVSPQEKRAAGMINIDPDHSSSKSKVSKSKKSTQAKR